MCVSPGNRERKLASLDQIVADVRQHRDKHQHQHEEEEGDFSTTPEITLPYHQPHFIMHHSHQTHNSTHGLSSKGATPVSASSSTTAAPLFDFDDGSDLDSPTGWVIHLLSLYILSGDTQLLLTLTIHSVG